MPCEVDLDHPTQPSSARPEGQDTSTSKPAIVIACGAWHVPRHYEPVAKQLRQAGYDVFTPQHQSIGIKKDPGNTMHADAAALTRIIQQFAGKGKDVILVMHSYGGVCGSEAVAMVNESRNTRLGAGRIRRLVYLAAHVFEKGTSMSSGRAIPGINTSEEGMMVHSDPYNRYYHEVSREVAAPALALLEPMAASAFAQETQFTGWKDYGIQPVTYIKCKQDTAVPLDVCDKYIARLREAGVAVDVETIEGGHCAHFTEPDNVTAVIERVAKSVEAER